MSTIQILETKESVSIQETNTKVSVVSNTSINTTINITNTPTQVNVPISKVDIIHVVERGLSGPAGSTVITKECGEILQANRVVYMLNNKLYMASSNNDVCIGRLFGITTQSGIVNQIIQVQNKDVFTNLNWNFTLNAPVFLGLNGEVTQDPNQQILYPIGNTVDTNKISINIGYPIRRWI
jgi:hypothetical protein